MQQNYTGSVSHRFGFANSDVVDASKVSEIKQLKAKQRKLHWSGWSYKRGSERGETRELLAYCELCYAAAVNWSATVIRSHAVRQWQFHCQKTNCFPIFLHTNLLRSCSTSKNSNMSSMENIPNAIICLGASYSYSSCSSFIIRHHGHWTCLPQTDTSINTLVLHLVLSLAPAQYYSMERLHLSYHTQQRETNSSAETDPAMIYWASCPFHSPKVDSAY